MVAQSVQVQARRAQQARSLGEPRVDLARRVGEAGAVVHTGAPMDFDDDDITPPPFRRVGTLDLHATGSWALAIPSGLIGAFCLWSAGLMTASIWPDLFGDGPLARKIIGFGGLGFLYACFLLVLGVAGLTGWRRTRAPLAVRVDDTGIQGFLLFARTAMRWSELTAIRIPGNWIQLRAGRRRMYINVDVLRAENGHDPGWALRSVLAAQRPDLFINY
jgi:hypothetical protein